MTADQIARYLNAGYTHYVSYENWRPILGAWVDTGFPTTKDALHLHEEAIKRRVDAGEIRNPLITPLA